MVPSGLRVCFVAPSAYGLLVRGAGVRHIGGAQAQQYWLARGLMERGHRVSFVVHDHGQADGLTTDGIRMFKAYAPDDGVPGLRFFHPRMTRLWAAMHRADADVYYQRGADAETGIVANWCTRRQRRFVFALAGHHMLLPHGPSRQAWRERKLAQYGMARADLILVQTHEQKQLLGERFRLRAEVLRNCSPSSDFGNSLSGPGHRNGVLWVGRIHPVKRLEWCLQAARLLPDVPFTIIGRANRSNAYAASLVSEADALPNVTRLDYVPPDRMPKHYRAAKMLLCTSVSEGFPNTFLEAFCNGTPIVTTVDPDGIVEGYGLGRVAHTPSTLADAISSLHVDGTAWQSCSDACMEYQKAEHDPGAVCDRLDALLRSLCGRVREGPAGPKTIEREPATGRGH